MTGLLKIVAGLLCAVAVAQAEVIAPDVLIKTTTEEVLAIVKKDKDIRAGDQKKILAMVDAKVLPHLLHGEETEVWGDQGYVGQTAVIAEVAPQARDCINRRCLYHGKLNLEEFLRNREKSKVRSKVEHVFQVLKLKFGFVKVRYRGIRKNGNRLFALFALVNLYIARKQLLRGAFA